MKRRFGPRLLSVAVLQLGNDGLLAVGRHGIAVSELES